MSKPRGIATYLNRPFDKLRVRSEKMSDWAESKPDVR
jgi:hypothetical protein